MKKQVKKSTEYVEEFTKEQQVIIDILNKDFLCGKGNPITIIKHIEAKLTLKLR